MEIRQQGFENSIRQKTAGQTFLRIGKVVGVNQGQKTVDVSLMDGGGTYYGVPVLSSMVSTASGTSHLPKMSLPDSDSDAPEAFFKRDIYAIVGFINGVGTLPLVLGFKHPELNQLSFADKEGFENQHLDRHESDRYQRVVGDTVAELGGEDKASEEEIRYPDNSYFKVYKTNGDKCLTNISYENEDSDVLPFRVKKDNRKGFYFQHSSGTRILIDPDGQIKLSHHTGTWLSISPNESDVSRETVDLETINSGTNPPTSANSAPVKVHLEHSSGTRLTIHTDGRIELYGVSSMDVTAVGNISKRSFTHVGVKAPRIDLN